MVGIVGDVAARCTGAPSPPTGGVPDCGCAPRERGRTARIGGACFETGVSPPTGCTRVIVTGGRGPSGCAGASPRTGRVAAESMVCDDPGASAGARTARCTTGGADEAVDAGADVVVGRASGTVEAGPCEDAGSAARCTVGAEDCDADEDAAAEAEADDDAAAAAAAAAPRPAEDSLRGTAATFRTTPTGGCATVRRPATGFFAGCVAAEAGAGLAGCGVYVCCSTCSASARWAGTTGRFSEGSGSEPPDAGRAVDQPAPIRPEGASCRTTCRSGAPNEGFCDVTRPSRNSCAWTVIVGLTAARIGASAAHDRPGSAGRAGSAAAAAGGVFAGGTAAAASSAAAPLARRGRRRIPMAYSLPAARVTRLAICVT